MHQLNKKQIGSHGTKECKISSGKCVHTFQKVFENTREDAIALANSTLVSALQTLGQTTICCQSNAYFTLPMCKLIRANNMLNTSEMFSDRILNAVPDCSSFVPPNIITSHYIWRCYETLDQMGLSNQRQLEEPQEEEAARSPVLKWRLRDMK